MDLKNSLIKGLGYMLRSKEETNSDLRVNSQIEVHDNNRSGTWYEDGLQCRNDALSTLELSTLSKTWIFDLDGTLLKHNGYKIDGHDTLLSGIKEYLKLIPEDDHILILTSRTDEFREMTVSFLEENGIRYDEIIFNIPMGERIVVNDRKPSGLDMAVAVNIDRDKPAFPAIRREK